MAPDICPNCGAEIPTNAKACPECGSDEQTGWSERAKADNLGLPDDEFNYSEFVEREFGDHKPARHHLPWFWWLVGVAVLLCFILLLLR